MKAIVFGVLTILIRQSFGATCGSFKTQAACGTASKCFWDAAKTPPACLCKDANADFVFLIDSSGSITAPKFEIQRQMVLDLLQHSIPANSGVGIIRFASDVTPITRLFPPQPISTVIQNVKDMTYTGGATLMGNAVEMALGPLYFGNPLETKTNLRIFLVTDGVPTIGATGVGPNGIDPCNYKDQIVAKNGLHVIILGVGGGFSQSRVTCLVQKETNINDWIIKIDKYTSTAFQTVLPNIDAQLCPAALQLTVTEVKPLKQLPTNGTGNTGTVWFEFINSGSSPAPLNTIGFRGMFQGFAGSSTDTRKIQPGQVVVVYNVDPSGFVPTCQACNCTKRLSPASWCINATYIPCGNGLPCQPIPNYLTHIKLDSWAVELYDYTSQTGLKIDSVAYDATPTNKWPVIPQGYTYALKSFFANNQKGANWIQSCNEDGTPGFTPVTGCNVTCNQAQCQINGDVNAKCVKSSGGSTCKCSGTYYYPDSNTCITLPAPPYCSATLQKGTANAPCQLDFEWGPVATPPGLVYLGRYKSNSLTYTTKSNIKKVQDCSLTEWNAGGASYGTIESTVSILDISGAVVTYSSGRTPCIKHTVGPTPGPTQPPLANRQLKVYVGGGLCARDRCSCALKSFDCVGPQILKKFSVGIKDFITIARQPLDFVENVTVMFVIDRNATGGRRRLQEYRRQLLSTGTTLSPNANTSCQNATEGVCPRQGYLTIPGDTGAATSYNARVEIKITSNQYPIWYFHMMSCTTPSGPCRLWYPSNFTMSIQANDAAGASLTTNQTPEWLWWLIGALILFLFLLALLAYQYWWKNRETTKDLGKTRADLDHAIAENELGFGHDLDAGDVVFNPIATGVPGSSNAPDFFTNEMAQRRGDAANQRADVPVEKFQHREQFGQVAGGNNKPNDLAAPLLG